MTASRIHVFPVPVTREVEPSEAEPAAMAAQVERLQAENSVLRERLTAVHAIALEREGTIEDLRHALQMLPSVWAEKLEEGSEASQEQAAGPSAKAASPEASVDHAELLFAEVAALRARLERRRLEAEQEILEQERRRLLADIEWTRNWQRSRQREVTET
jgi:hypothetical protein